MVDKPRRHGIQSAHYTSNGEYYYPVLDCLCGWNTSRGVETWEEAGAEFDIHLRDAVAKGEIQ